MRRDAACSAVWRSIADPGQLLRPRFAHFFFVGAVPVGGGEGAAIPPRVSCVCSWLLLRWCWV